MPRGLLVFAFPILLGQIFQQLYNTADALIVGQFLSDSEYAAVTSSGHLIFLLVGFFSGISVGAGVVIARYFGAKDDQNLETAVHTTVMFGLIAGLFLTVLGVLTTPTLLTWMGTPKKVFPYAVEYFRYYFAGALAVVLYNLLCGILQAVGDSKHPLYYLILSSVINIVLDLLFIGGFHFGVWSAALATAISQFVSVILCLWRLMRVREPYRLRFSKLRLRPKMLGEIIRYGLPTGVQNSIIAFANVIVQTNINSFGDAAMGGCGTYAKLEGFAFLPINCFAMALTTFVSQNIGARQFDRVKKGSRFGVVCCLILAEVIGAGLFFFAEPLMRLFSDNPAVLAIGVRQARVESPFFFALAFSHCIAAILRGAGWPTAPMAVMFAVWCVFRVTYLSVLVPWVGQIWVIFSAYPVTWSISSVIFLILYRKVNWAEGRHMLLHRNFASREATKE